jgi:thiamine-phosphate pyrophosphorylase
MITMQIPALYPILDTDSLSTTCAPGLLGRTICEQATQLFAAGCTLLQLRAKQMPVNELLSCARELRRLLPSATLIMNDRADLCLAADFDGVHVGQQDLSPQGARAVVGPARIVGLSTHNVAQFSAALLAPVDYLAIGPVFATASKQNVDPVVGLECVAEARRLLDAAASAVPLVAIGGITRANAQAVRRAGADSVAVIGDISCSPGDSAREFFRLMM